MSRENASSSSEGHQGMAKMKVRLRECMWWPGTDSDVVEFVRGCRSCQLVGCKPGPEPLTSTELPDGPWQLVSADLMDVENGYHLLIVIDYFSRWSDVAVLRNTSTTNVMRCMERFFVTHGLPRSMRTDNGPQFMSEEFRHFMEENGIEHAKGIPYWPPSNGEVERHNET